MSEKRHFKLYASGHVGGDSKNFLRLFDAISKQENYDESKIKNEFEGAIFVRHLPAEKNYLYSYLLESLNAYHREKTFLARHANFLISIELLFNRGLFRQCLKIIKKAKAESYALEKQSLLVIMIRWETLVHINNEDELNLNKSIAEEIHIMEIMRIQTQMMQIAFKIQTEINKGKLVDAFLEESLKKLKATYPNQILKRSFWINYYYLSSKALIYAVQNQHQKRYNCFKKIKIIMDNAPQLIQDLSSIYHINSNNLVNVMCFLEKYEEARSIVQDQKKFIEIYQIKKEVFSKIVFINTSESELFLFYKSGKYDDAIHFIKEIEQIVKRIELDFNPIIFDLLFMIAVCEFLANNFKNSIKYLNQIMNAERKLNIRMEVKINVRLLYLLVLFESHDRLFETRFNSTKRFITQDAQFHNSLSILEGIRMLSDPKLMKNKKGDFLKYISRIRKDFRKTNEAALNKQFDFAEWLEKKVE